MYARQMTAFFSILLPWRCTIWQRLTVRKWVVFAKHVTP